MRYRHPSSMGWDAFRKQMSTATISYCRWNRPRGRAGFSLSTGLLMRSGFPATQVWPLNDGEQSCLFRYGPLVPSCLLAWPLNSSDWRTLAGEDQRTRRDILGGACAYISIVVSREQFRNERIGAQLLPVSSTIRQRLRFRFHFVQTRSSSAPLLAHIDCSRV